MYTGLWWGSLREREHVEDMVVDGNKRLKCILNKYDGGRGQE